MSNDSGSFANPVKVYNHAGGNITVVVKATNPTQTFQKIVPGGQSYSPNFDNDQKPTNLSAFQEGPGNPPVYSASLPLPDGSSTIFYVTTISEAGVKTGINISAQNSD